MGGGDGQCRGFSYNVGECAWANHEMDKRDGVIPPAISDVQIGSDGRSEVVHMSTNMPLCTRYAIHTVYLRMLFWCSCVAKRKQGHDHIVVVTFAVELNEGIDTARASDPNDFLSNDAFIVQ